jgi:hypothetical protein
MVPADFVADVRTGEPQEAAFILSQDSALPTPRARGLLRRLRRLVLLPLFQAGGGGLVGRVLLFLGTSHNRHGLRNAQTSRSQVIRTIRASDRPTEAPSYLPFEIYTFVTNDDQYTALRSSFARAGFDAVATYVRLSDQLQEGRGSDPYEAIAHIGRDCVPPYAILCHQDVRLDQGVGATQLLAAIARLDASDPGWVVAGNAGVTWKMQLVRLVDPHGGPTDGVSEHDLPLRVMSLDENFLLFNRRQSPHSSVGLKGFHLYGTDVCLNALLDGGATYVIDFPLTHLSSGNMTGYSHVKRAFLDEWNRRFVFRYIRTPNDTLFVSRYAVLRRIFGCWAAVACIRAASEPDTVRRRAS